MGTEITKRTPRDGGKGRGLKRNLDLKGIDLHRPSIESRRVAAAEEELRRMREKGAVSAGAVDKVID